MDMKTKKKSIQGCIPQNIWKKKYLRVEYYIYKILQHIYMMSIYIKNNISWFLELSFVSFPLGIYKKCISLKIEVECRWKKLSLLDAMRDQNIIHVFIHYTKIRSKTKLSELTLFNKFLETKPIDAQNDEYFMCL